MHAAPGKRKHQPGHHHPAQNLADPARSPFLQREEEPGCGCGHDQSVAGDVLHPLRRRAHQRSSQLQRFLLEQRQQHNADPLHRKRDQRDYVDPADGFLIEPQARRTHDSERDNQQTDTQHLAADVEVARRQIDIDQLARAGRPER